MTRQGPKGACARTSAGPTSRGFRKPRMSSGRFASKRDCPTGWMISGVWQKTS